MTVYALAVIDSNTEVYYLQYPGAVFDDEGPWKQDNSYTVVHIHSEVPDMTSFRQTSYYKNGEWKSREWKGDYYTWSGDTESWSFNSSKFWEEVRMDRNNRLYQCDWTQSPDSPLSDSKKAEWAEYRTILRGIPAQESSTTELDQIVWPDKPS